MKGRQAQKEKGGGSWKQKETLNKFYVHSKIKEIQHLPMLSVMERRLLGSDEFLPRSVCRKSGDRAVLSPRPAVGDEAAEPQSRRRRPFVGADAACLLAAAEEAVPRDAHSPGAHVTGVCVFRGLPATLPRRSPNSRIQLGLWENVFKCWTVCPPRPLSEP